MINSDIISQIFLFFLASKLVVQLYLNLRNSNYISKHKLKVPDKFEHIVSLKEHTKAAHYNVEKGQFARVQMFFSAGILYAWTIGGGLLFLDNIVQAAQASSIVSGLIFFILYGLFSMMIQLPFSLYSTFVIEEKYGFNKMSLKLYFVDMFKQIIISALFAIPLIIILLTVMEYFNNSWWILGWAIVSLFQLFMLWAYPAFVAPMFNKFSPITDQEIIEKIKALCQKVNFKYSGLFVMDASKRSGHGNAYFTGFGKNKRIVFYDTLLKTLDSDEVEAVLAHELGHFKLKHVLKMIIRSFVFSLIGFYILGLLANSELFYFGHGVKSPSNYMAIVLFLLVSDVYTFSFTPLFSWMSRKQEFEADSFAAKHSNAKKLISALLKMYKDNASSLTIDPIYADFYLSHPPAIIRVEHLENINRKN